MNHALTQWIPIQPKRSAVPLAVPLAAFLMVGTGGELNADRLSQLCGTGSLASFARAITARGEQPAPAVQIQAIKDALRLSVAELGDLFGVTRQSIYNWQNGNAIDPSHAERLRNIAGAVEQHFELLAAQTGHIARRAIQGRDTLLQVLKSGGDPQEAFARLADILTREAAQRDRLAKRLQARTGSRGAADIDTLG